MLLILAGLLKLGCKHLTSLLFLNFVDLSEGTTAQFLDQLETALKNGLTVLKHDLNMINYKNTINKI